MGEAISRTLLEADYRVVSIALDLPEFELAMGNVQGL